jgi:uncharacterized membrane protein YtjA (UPF0391 family)
LGLNWVNAAAAPGKPESKPSVNQDLDQTNVNQVNQTGLDQTIEPRSVAMLGWAVTFLIIALIAAVLGFGGIAGFAIELAKIVFVVAIILFVISAIFGFMRGRSPTLP